MNLVLCDGGYKTKKGGEIRCDGDVTAIAKDDLLAGMTSAGQMSEASFNSLLTATLEVFVVVAIVVLVLRLLQNR